MQGNKKLNIVPATPESAVEVSRFCQPIYQAAYPNKKYKIKPEQFDAWIFESDDTLSYFREVLQNNERQRAYLARLHGNIVGTIAITEFDDHYEPRCFYVSRDLQGQGIGSKLWEKAMAFCTKPIPIRVEVAETNRRTIAMYKKWGFKHNKNLGVRMRHWPEWPDGVQNGYIFLEKRLK